MFCQLTADVSTATVLMQVIVVMRIHHLVVEAETMKKQ